MIIHKYRDQEIRQANQSTDVLPAGYVNTREICKSGGKRQDEWLHLTRTKKFLEALSVHTEYPIHYLLWGDWGDVEVAIEVCRWVSPDMGVWASSALRELIIDDEHKHAEKRRAMIWRDIRGTGLETRTCLMSAINQYVCTHKVDEDYQNFIVSIITEKINVGMFHKTSYQMKMTGRTRDTFTANELLMIDRIEDYACRVIRKGTEPSIAIDQAIAFYL